MLSQSIALYNWNNGVIMIGIFALVCITLVGILVKFIATGDRKNNEPKEDEE